jgi:hypothetical protein
LFAKYGFVSIYIRDVLHFYLVDKKKIIFPHNDITMSYLKGSNVICHIKPGMRNYQNKVQAVRLCLLQQKGFLYIVNEHEIRDPHPSTITTP